MHTGNYSVSVKSIGMGVDNCTANIKIPLSDILLISFLELAKGLQIIEVGLYHKQSKP
jgi:hypothetical protein